ncbi:hypothetical protein [Pantoea vagans]|jgi:hypothetical protein|uniref:hypothetical protein n=1 Tax=Pantoea vagans TaxID=470934 RepID=UPI0015C72B13|nr:hypothetical protein [Pantoea vagans]
MKNDIQDARLTLYSGMDICKLIRCLKASRGQAGTDSNKNSRFGLLVANKVL